MKFLLDYVFKISSITPTPQASTAFLKQVCVVCKPVTPGVGIGVITACTSQTQIAAVTGNLEAQQVLAGGLSKVYILVADDLGLATYLDSVNDFFTLLVSSDFDGENEDSYATGAITISSYANLVSAGNDTVSVAGQAFTAGSGAATPGAATFQAATSNNDTATSLAAQINAHAVVSTKVEATAVGAVVNLEAKLPGIEGHYALAYVDNGTATVGASVSAAKMSGGEELLDVGTFKGVVGFYSQSVDTAAAYAATENRVGFFGSVTNKAKNMMFAFGKFLSNPLNWTNIQYTSMPFSDGVGTLGDAESLFDDKVSFVITDDEYSRRLSLFAVGGKAIIAPYVTKNLQIDMQSDALSFISGNQPTYTPTNATLLENKLQNRIDLYIARGWIEAGEVQVKLEQDNFVASGYINITEPNAMWRAFGEIRQTL